METVVQPEFEAIAANALGKPRRAKLHGREHLVVPASLIVPGVLNGSNGPLFYSSKEVARKPGIWNNIPVVINHPKDKDGKHVSARSPEIIEQWGIGTLYNDRWDGKKRVADAWIDVERMQALDLKMGTQLFNRLEKGEPVELSTGLETKNIEVNKGSTHAGIAYSHEARNYVPDHLALLTSARGACSLLDGCGLNVNEDKGIESTVNRDGTITIKTKGPEQRASIWQKLGELLGMTANETSNECSCDGSGDELCEKCEKEHIEVKEKTNNESGDHLDLSNEGDSPMKLDDKKRETIVANLCKCKTWKGREEVLNDLDDDNLQALTDEQAEIAANAEEVEGIVEAVREMADDGELAVNAMPAFLKKKMGKKAKDKEVVYGKDEEEEDEDEDTENAETEEQYLGKAPASVRETLNAAKGIVAEEKRQLVQRLVANVKDDKRRNAKGGELLKKTFNELKQLEEELKELAPPAPAANEDGEPDEKPTFFFGGAGGGRRQARKLAVNTDEEAAVINEMEPPVLDYAKEAEERRKQRASA